MTKSNAYIEGREMGITCAAWLTINPNDHADWYELDKAGRFDLMVTEAYESEEHARQYSPFEVTAKEFNESHDPDAMWAAYERGVAVGITKTLRKRMA